jgi:hypothetical protein
MQKNADPSVIQTLKDLTPLIENLLLLLSDKEKIVITKRFNLDGTRKHTLEEIGQEFSVTRERIRQIEKNALSKMKRNVFNTSFKFLHALVTNVVGENGGLICEKDLVSSLDGVVPDDLELNEDQLHLAFVLHDDLESIGNTINFHPHLRDRQITDYTIKHVANQLVNQLQKYGDVRDVARVHQDMKKLFEETDFNIPKTKSLISIDKRLTLIDDGMVGLLEWRHIHPRTLRDKILFILRNEKKPLHFTYISEKIEGANFDNKKVNVQAVHNELIRHDQFVLVGRGIYALKEWGYEKGTVADVILDILKDKKEFSQDEIVSLVLKKRQVKKITIILALKNNEKFERTGRKMYKLKK